MNDSIDGEDERGRGRRDFGKKDKSKKDKKDKGYVMFEEEDSEEEPMIQDDTRSPAKLKKHKPSFKFAKREKLYRPKEKDKDREKEEKRERERREREEREKREKKEREEKERRERKEREEKERKEREWKEQKKKEKEMKLKLKKNKLLSGSKQSLSSQSSLPGGTVSPVVAADDPHAVFGVPLAVAVERSRCHDGIELPVIFRECINHIEEHGLTTEGIYRISGVKSKVQGLKELYNKGQQPSVYLLEHEPSIVASLLKQYLRDLPEPVLTTELMPKFEQASTLKNVKLLVEEFKRLISLLPTPNRLLLSWMIVHMTHIIALEKQNKMSLQNVSIVLSPTMQISHRVLNVFFTYAKIFFRDTVIKRYVPPLRPVSSRWSLELPDSPSAIEEELTKQESLLDQLHSELQLMKDTEKEEQLWEVQRVVTQLKRKLKHAKKAHEAIQTAAKKEEDLACENTSQKQQLKLNLEPKSEETIGPDTINKLNPKEAKSSPQVDVRHVDIQTKGTIKIDEEGRSKEENVSDVKDEEQEDDRDLVTPTLDSQVHLPDTEDSDTEPIEEGPLSDLEMEKLTVKEEEKIEEKVEVSTPDAVDEDVFDEEDETKEIIQTKSTDVEASETTTKIEISQEGMSMEVAQNKVAAVAETIETVREDVQQGSSSDVLEESKITEDHSKEIPEDNQVTTEAEEAKSEHLQPDEDEQHAKNKPAEHVEKASAKEADIPEAVNEEKMEKEVDMTVSQSDVTVIHSQVKTTVPFSSILMPVKLYDEMRDHLDYYQQAANFEDDEEFVDLLRQHTALLLEEEELLDTGSELRQKIESEHSEIERLHQDISDVRAIRQDLYSSDEDDYEDDDSDDGSSDESLEEEILLEMLQQLTKENKELVGINAELVEKIHQEQQVCLAVKVEIRMLQHKQLKCSQQTIESLL